MFQHRNRFSAMSMILMSVAAEAAAGAGPVQTAKTSIRPNVANYTTAKSASGSTTKICGDDVSKALLGATLDESYGFVSKVVSIPETELRAKYGSRNLGQQRMFLGNLIRGAFAGKDAERASVVRKAFEANLPAFRQVIDSRVAADTEAKEQAKAAKDKAKADAKAQAKAEKDAKKAEAAKAKAEAAPKAPVAAPAKAPTPAKAPVQPAKQ